MPSIGLDNLTIAYNGNVAIRQLCGTFAAGSLTAVVGPNGAGKSTLLKAIAGLLRPAEGSVRRSLLRRGDLAYLPQRAELDPAFPITVFDTVIAGAWRSIGAFRRTSPAIGRRAGDALAAVGLDGFGSRMIDSLSAGQLQRTLFARMLLQDARLILLDEPFAAIDQATTSDLLRLVRRWESEGRTVIAVLHDLDQVRAQFPTTLMLACRQIAWGPTEAVLVPENLRRLCHLPESPVAVAMGRTSLRAVG